jgi:hypothetical protein
MPGLASPESDLFCPLPGSPVDTHLIHTHYFGFSIPGAGLGAYLYVRYQPAFPLSQGGVIIFRGLDNVSILDADYVDYRMTMPWPEIGESRIATANGLEIEFTTPGQEVRIRYASPEGSVTIDLLQQAVTPLVARHHIFPGEDANWQEELSPGGSEQFMHCTGVLQLRGEEHAIDCFAPRDRSWCQVRGEVPEVASPPVGWSPMYFGPDLALNQIGVETAESGPAWLQVYPDYAGPAHRMAWLWRDGELIEVSTVRREVHQRHPQLYSATSQTIEIQAADGPRHVFRGEAVAMCAVPAWPDVSAHDSVYRWTDEQGRVCYAPFQEAWFGGYQRALCRRAFGARPTE